MAYKDRFNKQGHYKKYDDPYNDGRNNPKRRNGCKFGYNKNDHPYVSGWKIINKELVSFYCSVNPNVGVEIVENAQGKEYQKWLCTVSYPKSAKRDELFTGFFDPDTKKVTIPDINIMLHPNARVRSGRGGVWFMNNN